MVFKAGTLNNKFESWTKIGASQTVLDWIKYGVHIPFSRVPNSFELNNSVADKYTSFIDSEINNLLLIGAISEVSEKPHCVSPINCVPKKNGKLRLIVDLRVVNESCNVPKFANENIETVCNLIKPEDSLVTIDLKNGFYH